MKIIKEIYNGQIKCYLCENLLNSHGKKSKQNPTGEVFYCSKKVTESEWSTPPTETIECAKFKFEY